MRCATSDPGRVPAILGMQLGTVSCPRRQLLTMAKQGVHSRLRSLTEAVALVSNPLTSRSLMRIISIEFHRICSTLGLELHYRIRTE